MPWPGVSLDRVRADLAVVAAQPHPMGSPEQAAVEAYLVRQLTELGLQPTVEEQRVTMAPEPPRSVWTGTVRTIVARVEGVGPDADQAVMLAAHYDSVTTGPGAGDNGAGVVSVLAAMRALTSAPPPRHDVVAAFVDGEEHEMLGSLAIVESAPWLRDVQVVVNTEGVGNAGRVTPALTAPDNGWALRQYLDAYPSPVVYSAFDAPLNAAGQGADLGRYQDVVPAGLELVGIGGLPAYHAGTDTAAGMHDGTLAEYVGTVVGLAQRLSQADLRSVQAPDLVAFTVVDGVTAAYPSTWSLPLAVLCVLAVVVVLGLAVRRGRVGLVRVVVSWLVLGVAGLAGILAGTALWLGAKAVDPRLSDAVNGGAYERTAYLVAAVAAAAAGVLLVLWPLRRRCSALEVVAGALVGWSVVALLLAVFLPDAAYVADLATPRRDRGVRRARRPRAVRPRDPGDGDRRRAPGGAPAQPARGAVLHARGPPRAGPPRGDAAPHAVGGPGPDGRHPLGAGRAPSGRVATGGCRGWRRRGARSRRSGGERSKRRAATRPARLPRGCRRRQGPLGGPARAARRLHRPGGGHRLDAHAVRGVALPPAR